MKGRILGTAWVLLLVFWALLSVLQLFIALHYSSTPAHAGQPPTPAPTAHATPPISGIPASPSGQGVARWVSREQSMVCYILVEPDPDRRWSALSCLPACMVADVTELWKLDPCTSPQALPATRLEAFYR